MISTIVRQNTGAVEEIVAGGGSDGNQKNPNQLGAFRKTFFAMHFIPIIDQADQHIAHRRAQADQQQVPLLLAKVKKVASQDTNANNGQRQSRATNQWQLYRLDLASTSRKHVGAMWSRFKLAAAKLGEEQLRYPAQG